MRRNSPVLIAAIALLVAQTLVAQNPLLREPSRNRTEIYSQRVPQFIREWSRTLQESVGNLSRRVATGDWRAAVPALLLAIVFGMVHIAGPGHGKVFAVSYFSANKARLRDGLLYSAVVNAVDSISALVVVVVGYKLVERILPGFRAQAPRVFELISYGLIVAFGVIHLISHLGSHSHDHAAEDAEQHPQPSSSRRRAWVLALSVGLVPCPVSSVLIVYGLVNQTLPFTLLLVAGVSFGGFLVMSTISGAVILGRSKLLATLAGRSGHRLSVLLEFAASGLIIAVGALFFFAAI